MKVIFSLWMDLVLGPGSHGSGAEDQILLSGSSVDISSFNFVLVGMFDWTSGPVDQAGPGWSRVVQGEPGSIRVDNIRLLSCRWDEGGLA